MGKEAPQDKRESYQLMRNASRNWHKTSSNLNRSAAAAVAATESVLIKAGIVHAKDNLAASDPGTAGDREFSQMITVVL